MSNLVINWRRILSAEAIRRSSHTLSVQNSKVIIFGGEQSPRLPVDNNLYVIDAGSKEPVIKTIDPPSDAPSPRVGAAATTVSSTGDVFLFSGRGGKEMTPLAESSPSSIWSLPKNSTSWTAISPPATSPYPEPRSYHSLTSDTRDAVFVHAGCPSSGRLSDLWAFQPSSNRWIQLADGPGPPRGGTSIAFCSESDKMYRFGGFDGQNEIGGSLDVYDPERNCWAEKRFEADGIEGPRARSVSALLAVTVSSRPFLLVLFGEGEPSDKGHAGAGRMFGDIWAWDVKGESWLEVEADGDDEPAARGWFAAGVLGDGDVVVHGGLGENNERFGDLWRGTLSFTK
jgi:hypothetical protein